MHGGHITTGATLTCISGVQKVDIGGGRREETNRGREIKNFGKAEIEFWAAMLIIHRR